MRNVRIAYPRLVSTSLLLLLMIFFSFKGLQRGAQETTPPEGEALVSITEGFHRDPEGLSQKDDAESPPAVPALVFPAPETVGGGELPRGGSFLVAAEDGGIEDALRVADALTEAPLFLEEAVGGPSEDEERSLRPKVFTHVVQPGETLSHIAAAYGIQIETILSGNNLADPNRIRVGDQLAILNVDGVVHRVRSGESLWEIARLYRVNLEEIAAVNDLQNPSLLTVHQELVIPGAQALTVQREAVVINGRLVRNFDWPVRGRLSSPYGQRWGRLHEGIDIAVPTGTSVRAAANGRVTFSGWGGGYGNLVIIDHGDSVETRYAHNSQLLVRPGDRVQRGQIIARSGNTGNSTGPHVHFEIRQKGRSVDPAPYLR